MSPQLTAHAVRQSVSLSQIFQILSSFLKSMRQMKRISSQNNYQGMVRFIMGSYVLARNMAMVSRHGQMAQPIKEIGAMEKCMVKVFLSEQTETNTRGNFNQTKRMAQANMSTNQGRNTKVCGKMTNITATALNLCTMAQFTPVISKMVYGKVSENT